MSLRPLLWIAAGGVIAIALAREGRYAFGLLYCVLVLLTYGYSLRVNPTRPCWRCRGRGRFKGWFWTYGDHACPACDGSGRRERWGRRFIGGE
jgi:hypothetical protein